MLIDRTIIFARSGKGGDGCVSFRREKFVPKGGPDGGDGGDGGDVILVGDASLSTLHSLARRPHLRAGHGQPGRGRSMRGADGADRAVPVPLGTMVVDDERSTVLGDVTKEGQRLVVANGGRGGFGNEHFKSPTNQTPREATPGEPWEERALRLELKMIADVGLIGQPNAGKSTMLAAITRARPRIADYPFTTRSPHLGLAELPGPDRRLVVADIPGLIEGAAAGAGLGHEFLRHVERTKVLVHLVDVRPVDSSDPAANYEAIRKELSDYSTALAEKPEIVALNKIDLVPEGDRASVVTRIAARLGLDDHVVTSGATGRGMVELLEACWQAMSRSPAPGWAHRANEASGGGVGRGS